MNIQERKILHKYIKPNNCSKYPYLKYSKAVVSQKLSIVPFAT